MRQTTISHPRNSCLLKAISFLAVLISSSHSQSALGSSDDPGQLDLRMTLTTGIQISVGEPIVVHYTIKNTAATGQITFHAGQKNNEWYRFSLSDAKGRTITVTPTPTVGNLQGLQHTPEATIPHGNGTAGNLVVTRYLTVPGPGIYTLRIHATTPYFVEPDGAWYPEGRPHNMPLMDLTRDFDFRLTVTPANPSVVMSDAEALRRKLMNLGNTSQWATLTEALFSMPEAEALPTWENLIIDLETSDGVLMNIAEQLASLGTPTAADLLGRLLFDRPSNNQSNSELVRAYTKR